VLSVAEVEKLAARMNTGNIIRVHVNLMTFRVYTTEAIILFCYLWFWSVKLSCILCVCVCVNSPIQEFHKYTYILLNIFCTTLNGEKYRLRSSPSLYAITRFSRDRHSAVGITARYWLNGTGFEFRWGPQIFCSSYTS